MSFTVQTYQNRTYLCYPLSPKSGTDPLLVGMLTNNHIPGFAEFSMQNLGGKQSLCYDIQGLRSMKEVFSGTVSRRTLLHTFDRILAALEAAQDYMIEVSSVVLEPQSIYMDPTTFRMALVCLPLMEYQSGTDEKSFFKSIMFNTIFDYNEPCEHVAKIMNYLNGSVFEVPAFRSLLSELGAQDTPAQAPASGESDPFFGLDFTAPAKAEPAFHFDFTPVPETKTPLQEAEDLLSAALQAPPVTKEAPTKSPSPLAEPVGFDFPESLGFDLPDKTDSDPLSIADQLLSAALNGQALPTAPTAEGKPLTPPAAPMAQAEEEGASARSRRARARREAREPQSTSAPAVAEVPKEAPTAQKVEKSPAADPDPFDFLSGFSPSGSVKKTDAMKAADAILSGLDLPTKDTKKTPAFDFSFGTSAVTDSTREEAPTEEEADFTTPIVSSRRKGASPTPTAKAFEAGNTPPVSSPATARKQEPVFDFSLEAKPASTVTDAMKVADELLSAALAGFSPQAPVAPKEDAPKKSAPAFDFDFTAPSQPLPEKKEEPSFDSDFFSPAPAKKTAAMEEAAAILDSLDLFAPVQETAPAPVTPTAPAQAPVVHREEPTSQQSPRKGGFFSKLRKKEELPPPPAQTPAQPVVPYFGNDGETTVLNVAQQPAKTAAPYLLRSSNQETVILSKPVFRIGKDRDFVDYCIADNSAISRRHANFMLRNGDIFIIDTNSTNHTYVNGVMIRSNTEVKLTHGDEIRLANEDFMLYCAGTL